MKKLSSVACLSTDHPIASKTALRGSTKLFSNIKV